MSSDLISFVSKMNGNLTDMPPSNPSNVNELPSETAMEGGAGVNWDEFLMPWVYESWDWKTEVRERAADGQAAKEKVTWVEADNRWAAKEQEAGEKAARDQAAKGPAAKEESARDQAASEGLTSDQEMAEFEARRKVRKARMKADEELLRKNIEKAKKEGRAKRKAAKKAAREEFYRNLEIQERQAEAHRRMYGYPPGLPGSGTGVWYN
ncbi:hypothetical protein FQN49_003607 [Arthroderma sp. PD_2]|nr:hypothetical protein FQN49_003607 [Arthroderma sp. PD_2]